MITYVVAYRFFASIGYDYFFLLITFTGFLISMSKKSSKILILRFVLMYVWILLCKLLYLSILIYLLGMMVYCLWIFGLLTKKMFTNPKEQIQYLMAKFDLFLVDSQLKGSRHVIKNEQDFNIYIEHNDLYMYKERYLRKIRDFEARGFKHDFH